MFFLKMYKAFIFRMRIIFDIILPIDIGKCQIFSLTLWQWIEKITEMKRFQSLAGAIWITKSSMFLCACFNASVCVCMYAFKKSLSINEFIGSACFSSFSITLLPCSYQHHYHFIRRSFKWWLWWWWWWGCCFQFRFGAKFAIHNYVTNEEICKTETFIIHTQTLTQIKHRLIKWYVIVVALTVHSFIRFLFYLFLFQRSERTQRKITYFE